MSKEGPSLLGVGCVLLVVGLVVPVFGVGEPVRSHAELGPGWRALGTPELVDRVDSGAGPFELIVMGPPHDDLALSPGEDRARAHELLEGMSAGFLQRVKERVVPGGGEVTDHWPAVPAVKVVGDLEVLQALGMLPEVRQIGVDHAKAVGLLDSGARPYSGEGDLGAMNTNGRQMVKAEEVWDLGYQGDGVSVAVIDSGVDPRHEAFRHVDGSSRIALWADCESHGCDSSGEPFDDNGHGTHVAGTVAGSSVYDDPEWGVFEETGVAPEASLLAVKFLGEHGGGSWGAALDSLEWSFQAGADVTVNSWGGSCAGSAPVIEMVDQYTDLGMISVFAAGNAGPGSGTVKGPACGEPALAVGAVDEEEQIAYFSSWGPCSDPRFGSDWSGTCPDLVAKGRWVRSAVPRSGALDSDPSGYASWQGTSMATPIVAGVIALSQQMKLEFTQSGWDTAQREHAKAQKTCAKPLPIDGQSPNNVTGWGLPDLLCVHDALVETTTRLIFSSELSDPQVRSGERTEFTWRLENQGQGLVSGELKVQLERPGGQHALLHASDVELGPGEDAQVTVDFAFLFDPEPGEYRFLARFPFQWANTTSGVIWESQDEQAAVFEVVRPQIALDLDLADEIPVGSTQKLRFEAVNEGNEVAIDAGFTVAVPQEYLFLPDGMDPLVPESWYADPAPDEVEHDLDNGMHWLHWRGRSLAPGEVFSFESGLLAAAAGDHKFFSFVEYEDRRGHGYEEQRVDDQSVLLT